ncbi:hypothetical protein [Streptomyces wedmorensis]|uniref:hypothetical protein n=1 Tax=Streptomyces wedmorensis TaxID=43759 RepID=UPI0037A09AE7
MLAKHEKMRDAMAKAVAKRDKGTPEWKPFGKGQVKLKPRIAPKTDRTPAQILKAWAGEVTHEIACPRCDGGFDCVCREDMSAVLADMGGPVVDADAVASGRARRSITNEFTDAGACSGQITMGEDVPTVSEDTAEPAPEFPVSLEPGETVAPYEGEHHRPDDAGYDWAFTTAAGHEYRLWARSWNRGEWEVARGLRESSFWWAEIEDNDPRHLAAAVAWCRKDSASVAWAADIWARYGHINGERVPWSAEPVLTELEDGAFRIARFGRVGLAAKYRWGWEVQASGHLAEAGSGSNVDGAFRKRAIHRLTVAGLDEIPTERWVIVGTDAPHGRDAQECGYAWAWPSLGGGACHAKKAPGRFLVDIVAEDGTTVMGRIGVCAWHLAGRLAEVHGHTGEPSETAHRLSGKTSGQWGSELDWRERFHELTAELMTAALDAGETNPRPDAVAPLYAEARAIGDQQAAKAARKAAREGNQQGERGDMGRGSMAPKAKAKAPKVGDIEFSEKNTFPCVATLLGHAYVVRKLAGTYSAQHEHSAARLIFEGQDPKNRCRTGGDSFPNLPAVKRAILADAVAARGEAQPEPVAEGSSNLPRPLRLALERDAAEELCEECEEDPCGCYDPDAVELEEERESEAAARFPELARWLAPRAEGDPVRVLNLFCGTGGGCVGLRRVLGVTVDMVCVDIHADAVATQRAAGCTAIQADVTTLDPSDPVFREVGGLIVTAPCIDYTNAGLRAGRLAENIEILSEAFDSARAAAGFIPFGGMGDHPDFGKELTHKEPNGRTWADVRGDLEGYTGKTGHLMLEVAVWSLGLQAAGAPLEWVAVEQSSELPDEIRGEVLADFQLAGWGMAEWTVKDAAEYGSPSHRVRALLVARRDGESGVSLEPSQTLETLASDATGLPADLEVITRGNRKTSGGNAFRMGRIIPGVTGKIRSVDVGHKGGRFTIEQIAKLVTLPGDHPLVGSRTSVSQQAADVFAPVVACALLGAALGLEWMPYLGRYLDEQYPNVHGQDEDAATTAAPAGTAENPAQTPAGDAAEAEEQASELADTKEPAAEWSYETERNPRKGCGSFPEPCNHAWPCGRDAVAWSRAQARERMERAAATPGAQLAEGETVTYAGASDDGYGHHFERMAYDWEIAEGRFRTTGNDLGDRHRHHGESPKGDNGWTTSVRCLHETCKGKVFKSVICDGEALLAMRAHGRKRHPAPAAPEGGTWVQKGTRKVLVVDRPDNAITKRFGADWEPLRETGDPELTKGENEPQAPAQAPLTRQQRRAAWRLAAGEEKFSAPAGEPEEGPAVADTEEEAVSVTPLDACGVAVSLGRGQGFVDLRVLPALEAAPAPEELTVGTRDPITLPYTAPARTFAVAPVVVQPDTGRACWEPGQRVTLNGRAGRTRYSTFDGVRVEWDDAPYGTDYVRPSLLWKEGTEPMAVDPEEAECWAQLAEEGEHQEEPQPELRGWFEPLLAPELIADEGPDYRAISEANRAARVEDDVEPPVAWATLTAELSALRTETATMSGGAQDWDDIAHDMDALRALVAEGREEQQDAPTLTWADVETGLATLRQDVKEPTLAQPLKVVIPSRLAREGLSLAASAAVVTLAASQVADVMPIGV